VGKTSFERKGKSEALNKRTANHRGWGIGGMEEGVKIGKKE